MSQNLSLDSKLKHRGEVLTFFRFYHPKSCRSHVKNPKKDPKQDPSEKIKK
jgi:hypothetical protein